MNDTASAVPFTPAKALKGCWLHEYWASLNINPKLWLASSASDTTVEAMLVNIVLPELKKFEPTYRPNTLLRTDNHRYRAISGVQKAIRRGDTEAAAKAATALYMAGFADHLWRRLAVISLEDIGLADLLSVTVVNMLAANKHLRGNSTSLTLALWAIERMCSVPKHRDLCLWAVMCDDPGRNSPEQVVKEIDGLDDEDLLSTDPGISQDGRFAMQWAVLHPKWAFRGQKFRVRDQGLKQALYDTLKTPALIRLLAKWHYAACKEKMVAGLPLTWWQMPVDVESAEDFFGPPDNEKIGLLYAASYDMHTIEGKRAMAYFAKINDPVKDFCAKHGADIKVYMDRAVFYAEGSVLHPRLHFPASDELYGDFICYQFGRLGIPPESVQEAILLMRGQIPQLNKVRMKMLMGAN
jgi:hypothetical protein